MTVIAESDRDSVRALLARELRHPVELLLFIQAATSDAPPYESANQVCTETQELLEDLVSLSERLRLMVCDVSADPTTANRFNVVAVPTVSLRRADEVQAESAFRPAVGRSDAPRDDERPRGVAATVGGPGVRFVGLPAGYEFSTLLADIVDVSKGSTDLAPDTVAGVRAVDRPVHIQVFVTPACPYCPGAARLAHKLAMENPLIVADVIEANEFPDLSQRYGVRSVPKTIINNRVQFSGTLAEPKLVEALGEALAHA